MPDVCPPSPQLSGVPCSQFSRKHEQGQSSVPETMFTFALLPMFTYIRRDNHEAAHEVVTCRSCRSATTSGLDPGKAPFAPYSVYAAVDKLFLQLQLSRLPPLPPPPLPPLGGKWYCPMDLLFGREARQ